MPLPRRPRCRRSPRAAGPRPDGARAQAPAAGVRRRRRRAARLARAADGLVDAAQRRRGADAAARRSSRSAHIFHIVSTKRGGGPLHFWLEHFLLDWWPGLPALRVPSLVFACLGLPGVGARRPPAGRPGGGGRRRAADCRRADPGPLRDVRPAAHPALRLADVEHGASSRAPRMAAARGWWIAGGLLLGLSVFVHPTAPLYALTAFGAAALYCPRPPREVVREAWPGAAALLVAFVPYYVKTLHVLSDRYGVGSGAGGRTFSGRPVWEDALHFVAPGRHDVNYFTVLAAVGVVALALARGGRVLAFCAITVAAPIVFFSIVPASGDSAIFFDRYMIPVTPAFFTVVLTGCLTIAARAGRLRRARARAPRRRSARDRVAVRRASPRRRPPASTSTRSSTRSRAHRRARCCSARRGRAASSSRRFDYGHPANILDHLVALRVARSSSWTTTRASGRFPSVGAGEPRGGRLAVLCSRSAEVSAASRRVRRGAKVVTVRQVERHYFVVRSRSALRPRALIGLGRTLRARLEARGPGEPAGRRASDRRCAAASRSRRSCVPYGELGDPDISPHWPPCETSHQ